MMRWFWFLLCAVFGLVSLVCGWLVPSHLRAIEPGVLQMAGKKTPTLVDQGLALIRERNLGGARLVWQAAEAESAPGREILAKAVADLARENPRLELLGSPEPRIASLGTSTRAASGSAKTEPFTMLVLRLENRDRVLEILKQSTQPVVQQLLRCRSLTNTVMFSPSLSSSGQAMDAAISVAALLLERGSLSSGVSDAVLAAAEKANRGGDTQPLEQALLDLMSLGQRFNWGQLAAITPNVQNLEDLRLLANVVRGRPDDLAVIFTGIRMSGDPAGVTGYLMQFSQTGVHDLGTSLRFGTGAVKELLARQQRVYEPAYRRTAALYDPFGAFYFFALEYALLMPWFALGVKWFFYFLGGCLLAASFHYGRGAVSALERPLQVRGFHFAREGLFGLGFLVVVLLLSEPFLSQDSQRVEFPLRFRLPMVGAVSAATSAPVHSTFMNQLSLLTLLLFFIIQGLIYTACLVKLAEIRRQGVPARIKLRLLENEDHLFDAGLYLGFVGTIISLILVSLGVIKPSLMAAYSSTSFGIIFVSFFKIFHLRPLRRKLLLESEAVYPDAPAAAVAPTLATRS